MTPSPACHAPVDSPHVVSRTPFSMAVQNVLDKGIGILYLCYLMKKA